MKENCDKTGPLENPKHEHFCQLVASGLSATKAYISAEFSEKGAAQSANRLLKVAKVRARLDVLRVAISENAIEKAAVDRARVLARLDLLSREAQAEGQYSSAIRAEELLGKELGMFRERLDVNGQVNIAAAILKRRVAAVKDEDAWLFPSERRPGEHLSKLNCQHDRACREAGVSFRLYDLRHTFATRLSESGCDLNTLAAILGHSGLRLLTRYVHPTDEHKRDAMKRFEKALRAPLRRVK